MIYHLTNSQISPRDFGTVAQPGSTYTFVGGHSTDPRYMLNIVDVHGTADEPIIFKTRGDTYLNGGGTHFPIKLRDCSYVHVIGMNACNSSLTVCELTGSNNCLIQEVCGWNAGSYNTNIFGVHYGDNNTFRHCAGWGAARKTFSCSQRGNNTLYDGCWGRWGCSVATGPKMVWTFSYDSTGTRLRNCIGTWNSRLPINYTLMGYNGKPWKPRVEMTGGDVRSPYGIFASDTPSGDADVELENCLAYIMPDQDGHDVSGIWSLRLGGIRIKNCVSIMRSDPLPRRAFILGDHNDRDVQGCSVSGSLEIPGKHPSQVWKNWKDDGVRDRMASLTEIQSAWSDSPIISRIALLASENIPARFAEITKALAS